MMSQGHVWDLSREGPVRLDGQWKFFRNEFVPPDTVRNRKDFSTINVPANWKDQKISSFAITLPGIRKSLSTGETSNPSFCHHILPITIPSRDFGS